MYLDAPLYHTISVYKVNGALQLLPDLLGRIVSLADQKQVPILVSVQFLHFLKDFLLKVNDTPFYVDDGVLQSMNDYHLSR